MENIWENRALFHRFSKGVFEALQGLKPLFHGFHMPYYYYFFIYSYYSRKLWRFLHEI